MSTKRKVKIEGSMDRAQVAAHLEDIVKSLSSGALHVRVGEESVLLSPGRVVRFEMEASQKRDKEKLVIEIGWERLASDAATSPEPAPAPSALIAAV